MSDDQTQSALDDLCDKGAVRLRDYYGICPEAVDVIISSARERGLASSAYDPFPTIDAPADAQLFINEVARLFSDRLNTAFVLVILIEAELYIERYGNAPPPKEPKSERLDRFRLIDGGKARAEDEPDAG